MPSLDQIQRQREQVLEELAQLAQVRRGTLTEQVVESVDAQGRKRQLGPYPLYTFKERGRTVSRRVAAAQVSQYRQQIERGRRFQQLTAQLLRLGEALSDLVIQDEAVKKTSKPKSKGNSKPTGSSNG